MTSEFSDNWEKKEYLVSNIETSDFNGAVDLIVKIRDIAEKMEHHPNLNLTNYNNLRIEIYSHESNSLEEKDYILANKLDDLLN